MKEPILLIMAAGMGSRYGGPKQIDPVGKNGEIIIDYSIYDAVKAGFKRIVCVIKKEIEKDFKEIIGDKISKVCEVNYAYQSIDDLPQGYEVPEGRSKPWGTGHAVLTAREYIDAPFAVINADDFYGREAFEKMYAFLKSASDGEKYMYSMVGYIIENTLTENGHVARGVCTVEDGKLASICERTRIEKRGDHASFTEDDGNTWTDIPKNSIVSMNLWGFTESIMKHLESDFVTFLNTKAKENPLKSEFFLPTVVNDLIAAGKAEVSVMSSHDRWYGVTYREDKQTVVNAIAKMVEEGKYPEKLW